MSLYVQQSRPLVELLAGSKEALSKEMQGEPSFTGKCLLMILFGYKEELLKDQSKFPKFILEQYRSSRKAPGKEIIDEALEFMAS